MVLLAAGAGVLGGALGVRWGVVPAVQAQEGRNAASVVQARSFVLVDAAGRKRGEWKLDADGQPVLTFYDENGRVQGDITPTPRIRPLTIR